MFTTVASIIPRSLLEFNFLYLFLQYFYWGLGVVLLILDFRRYSFNFSTMFSTGEMCQYSETNYNPLWQCTQSVKDHMQT